jgi:Putative peptidoglycan binding domain
MTIAMPDSIYPANLPAGYPAYLGYVDGSWPTAAELRKLYPAAHLIMLTVTGGTLDADGCDMERFDLSQTSGAAWLARKLAAAPGTRPVGYASVSWMPAIISDLGEYGVARSSVRLLSAHYDPVRGAHICGPHTCAYPGVPDMDGTQWTSTFPGVRGSLIDMSALRDDFFGAVPPPAPDWQVQMMQALPELSQGATGGHVRTVQGLCNARGHYIMVDGVFGPATTDAVRRVQTAAHITVDGVVGPQTWPALMGV